jgi:ubiquinone/menaquinone biosynthesis C-methylase UbiE
MPDHIDRFSEAGHQYAQFRPAYPIHLVTSLALRITRVSSGTVGTVLDVGSGTGIFTRQLRAALPAAWRIIGIEPAATMRDKAILGTNDSGVAFIEGRAEELPTESANARAIVAATAAHWFDRPLFYKEARRVLVDGGVLAILEYVRAPANSPAVAAVEDFLSRYGDERAYVRPDYGNELSDLKDFHALEEATDPVVFNLSVEQFVGLALSSSHARQAVATLGYDRAVETLRNIGISVAGEDNTVAYSYNFQSFSVVKH